MPPMPLASWWWLLDGASGDAGDDPALGEDVDEQQRRHRHQVGRERDRVVGVELALEHVLRQRQRRASPGRSGSTSGRMKSFHAHTQVRMPTVAFIGTSSGKITFQNTRQVDAPSMRAASSSSIGIDRM